jgi:hypothetical protein
MCGHGLARIIDDVGGKQVLCRGLQNRPKSRSIHSRPAGLRSTSTMLGWLRISCDRRGKRDARNARDGQGDVQRATNCL